MEWFLINILSPLLLPIFLIAVIGLLCDIKPDAFIKIYIDILQTAVLAVFRCLLQVSKICFDFLCRFFKCLVQCLCCAAQAKSDTAGRCKPCPPEKPSDPDSEGTTPPKKRAPRKPKESHARSNETPLH